MHSVCRSCGKRITWVKTASGKAMPIDEEPVENGNLVIDNGVAVHVPPGSKQEGELLYVSHFATCKNKAQHRRKS